MFIPFFSVRSSLSELHNCILTPLLGQHPRQPPGLSYGSAGTSYVYNTIHGALVSKSWASAEIFEWSGNVEILLIVFRLLAKQYKRTFKKHFSLSKQQRKCAMLGQ